MSALVRRSALVAAIFAIVLAGAPAVAEAKFRPGTYAGTLKGGEGTSLQRVFRVSAYVSTRRVDFHYRWGLSCGGDLTAGFGPPLGDPDEGQVQGGRFRLRSTRYTLYRGRHRIYQRALFEGRLGARDTVRLRIELAFGPNRVCNRTVTGTLKRVSEGPARRWTVEQRSSTRSTWIDFTLFRGQWRVYADASYLCDPNAGQGWSVSWEFAESGTRLAPPKGRVEGSAGGTARLSARRQGRNIVGTVKWDVNFIDPGPECPPAYDATVSFTAKPRAPLVETDPDPPSGGGGRQ